MLPRNVLTEDQCRSPENQSLRLHFALEKYNSVEHSRKHAPKIGTLLQTIQVFNISTVHSYNKQQNTLLEHSNRRTYPRKLKPNRILLKTYRFLKIKPDTYGILEMINHRQENQEIYTKDHYVTPENEHQRSRLKGRSNSCSVQNKSHPSSGTQEFLGHDSSVIFSQKHFGVGSNPESCTCHV